MKNKRSQNQVDCSVENRLYMVRIRVTLLQDFLKKGIIIFLLCITSYSYADVRNNVQNLIDGIGFENYPRVDGSTSTLSLNTLIAAKLLGIGYKWDQSISGEWAALLNREDIPEEHLYTFGECIKVSRTHGAFINLIEGKTDLILTQSMISPEEKAYADELGVSLIETAIALDAFVFLVNEKNAVRNLTVEQIQHIYTGEITNWKQVGGSDMDIMPFVRPANSGSQQTMQSLVMGELEIADYPESSEIAGMAGVFPEIYSNENSICYTFNYYKEKMVRVSDEYVPKIAVNGILPDANTIKKETYPFVANVYVSIRSDQDKNTMAYKMYEWLQAGGANDLIEECGFVPKSADDNSIVKISDNSLQIYPNPASEGFYINGIEHPAQLIIFDFSGRLVLSKQVIEGDFINIRDLSKGIYFVKVNEQTLKLIKR